MNKIIHVLLATFVVLTLVRTNSHAIEVKDSSKVVIAAIDKAFQRKKISEAQYLDTVHKTILYFQSNNLRISKDELLKLLAVYREIAWKSQQNKQFRQTYYTMLSNQARTEKRNGEMLYFAQKLNELEQLNGNAYSVNSIFFIVSYYYDKYKYAQVAGFYPKYKEFLNDLPARAANKELERRELMRGADLLSFLCMASYNAKDTLQGREIEHLMEALEKSIKKAYPEDKEIWVRLQYSKITTNNEKRRSLNDKEETWKSILQLDSLLLDPNTPDYLKSYLQFNIRDTKTLFFLDHPNNDSAARYIDLMNSMSGFSSVPSIAYMIKKYESRLLYNKGLYKASEDSLVQALIMLEATNATATDELDDLIYTLTKVEDQQLMLNEAAAENKRKEQLIKWVSFGGVLLLLSGVGGFLFIRQRQRRKFLEFKLNMARNVHDETGPALLYAKSLAKSCKVIGDNEKMRAELENHIDNTIAVIRSLSHDLKADKLFHISDLIATAIENLNKLKLAQEYDYIIEKDLDNDRFISNYQYSQLKAILQECFTNSIKHAHFDKINLKFNQVNNRLLIAYSDNGQGWDPQVVATGIGLKNIEERCKNINADLNITNNYPYSYEIAIKVLLR